MIRVLVVEDSLTVRKRLVEVLNAELDMEVVGEAEDGRRAVELCRKLRPDVVTLDMVLPEMNGLAATEQIMAFCPTPILVVSASANRRDLFKTYDALSAGALAVFEKPGGDIPLEDWRQLLTRRVRMVSRIKVVTHPRARLAEASKPVIETTDVEPFAPDSGLQMIVMGASTGGPRAVLEILGGLPSSYRIPILLVIHIGPTLGVAMADWLAKETGLNVTFAEDGEPLPGFSSGRVIMAPPDYHLVVDNDRLRLTRDEARNYCRPSVDVLFESAARRFGSSCVGCLLTGMGRDGAAGLEHIHNSGGLTLAQDEETSAVFGMPGEAIRRGAVQRVLPVGGFAPALVQLAELSRIEKGAS